MRDFTKIEFIHMEDRKNGFYLMLNEVSKNNTRFDLTYPPVWREADEKCDAGNWCPVKCGYTGVDMAASIKRFQKKGFVLRE